MSLAGGNSPVDHFDFDSAFENAIAAVDIGYLLVPVTDSEPVVRERAFAYELYHQLRRRSAKIGYTLTGELEKAAHPDLRQATVRRLAPDLLLHVPGDRRENFVAIEIKGGVPKRAAFLKDLASLSLLRDRFGYERLIYLVYGITSLQVSSLIKRLRAVTMLPNGERANLRGIELWVRETGKKKPRVVQWSPLETR